jgi:glycosyltransferase involved in cell wall biosynthesis
MLGVSNSVRDDLRRDLPSWHAERIQTLYNRIDIEATQAEMLERSQARCFLGLPDNAWIVGNVGRLHHDKDQKTLIQAFHNALPKLPNNSLLVIMGSGPLESALKEEVINLGMSDHVVFTGNVAEGRKYFKAFDLFALTSDHEPFGMVLLEAMAAELPIISSDCGGGAEVVKGAGELFHFGDYNTLAQKIIDVHNANRTRSSQTSNKLKSLFSDEAVRSYFWKIPFVAKLVKNK